MSEKIIIDRIVGARRHWLLVIGLLIFNPMDEYNSFSDRAEQRQTNGSDWHKPQRPDCSK